MQINIKNNIRIKILKELAYIGYDVSLCGTRYLVESIYLIINKKIIDNLNLDKEIYPALSKKYQKSANNIRCNIEYATEIMYNRIDSKVLMSYFNFYENVKPTIKQVIYTVFNKIILN